MDKPRDHLTCDECENRTSPATSHPASSEDGYVLNNVERATTQEIMLLVQCEHCGNIFKPVFTYTGNSDE